MVANGRRNGSGRRLYTRTLNLLTATAFVLGALAGCAVEPTASAEPTDAPASCARALAAGEAMTVRAAKVLELSADSRDAAHAGDRAAEDQAGAVQVEATTAYEAALRRFALESRSCATGRP